MFYRDIIFFVFCAVKEASYKAKQASAKFLEEEETGAPPTEIIFQHPQVQCCQFLRLCDDNSVVITRRYTTPKKQSLFPMLMKLPFRPTFVEGLDHHWVRDASGTIVECDLEGVQSYDDEMVVGELSLAVPTKFKSADTPLYLSKYYFLNLF